jgi:hypothetical protein
VNPKAETVEELLARRKNLHLGMLKLAREDLALTLRARIDNHTVQPPPHPPSQPNPTLPTHPVLPRAPASCSWGRYAPLCVSTGKWGSSRTLSAVQVLCEQSDSTNRL